MGRGGRVEALRQQKKKPAAVRGWPDAFKPTASDPCMAAPDMQRGMLGNSAIGQVPGCPVKHQDMRQDQPMCRAAVGALADDVHSRITDVEP